MWFIDLNKEIRHHFSRLVNCCHRGAIKQSHPPDPDDDRRHDLGA